MILCPHCEKSLCACEQVHRGRRFFLMGALALPIARKIESVAAIIKPPYEPPKITWLGRVSINGQECTYERLFTDGKLQYLEGTLKMNFAVAT